MGKLAKFASYMYVLETREDETLQSRGILQMWGGGAISLHGTRITNGSENCSGSALFILSYIG